MESDKKPKLKKKQIVAVDLFCGIGGLTHGLVKAGIHVAAGIDIDATCQYAYEANNKAVFLQRNMQEVTGEEINAFYPAGCLKLLVGCAPCQPFSKHTQKIKDREQDEKWKLLDSFLRLIKEVNPDLVSMENVPQITKYEIFTNFKKELEGLGYEVFWQSVFCPRYGVPQNRTRLVLLASKLGPISLVPPTHQPKRFKTVRGVIGELEKIGDGCSSIRDSLHISSSLTAINKNRIKQSKPGGKWTDWDEEILADCHKKETGKTYSSVYGRMTWDNPSPTITTQFFSFGTGRFGHPEQDRALSLREGAMLQTFPKSYDIMDPDKPFSLKRIGIHIGNAVPVRLGVIIGRSILKHLETVDA